MTTLSEKSSNGNVFTVRSVVNGVITALLSISVASIVVMYGRQEALIQRVSNLEALNVAYTQRDIFHDNAIRDLERDLSNLREDIVALHGVGSIKKRSKTIHDQER